METDQLRTDVRQRESAAVIDLNGDIDGFAQDTIAAAYDKALHAGTATIILNFAGVNYVNSTGIALIVSLIAQARQEGKQLLACGLSEHYIQIFEITRLTDFISLFPNEGDALESLKAQ
jgi:anti-sigma B factor antagonist